MVEHKEQALSCEGLYTEEDSDYAQCLRVGGRCTSFYLWTTAGSTGSLLSSNHRSEVTALLEGKSYVLTLKKVLALSVYFILITSQYHFETNDTMKLLRIRNLK